MKGGVLRLLLVISILLMPLQVYGSSPKIVKAWLGVFRYNGTYYDPLGNTFDGKNSYKGWDYEYVVINYQLDNGEIIRQVIKLNDNLGTTNPAPTVATSWIDPDGKRHTIFRQDRGNTYNVTPLPYITNITPGSLVEIRMNDNYRDDNYADGHWIINISENGISFINARQSGGYFHNLSFVFQNLNRSITWEVPMPYKYGGSYERYSSIIPFNGSNVTIYDISGNTPYRGQRLQYSPPQGFVGYPVRVPIPIGAVIVSVVVVLWITYRRME